MITRFRAVVFTGAAIIVGLLWARPAIHREKPTPPRVSIQPAQIVADGYDTATLTLDAPAAPQPKVSIAANPHAATIEDISRENGRWQAQIRAGIIPGRIALRVEVPGSPPATAQLTATPFAADRFEDGTPDFLRLDDSTDQQAFRRWFTYIAEAQYFQPPANRPPEIDDCAALIRYAYREALHVHDSGWAEAARLPMVPAFPPVAKYQYPYTPLGAALFRISPGPFRPPDLTGASFAQFADAETLCRFNTHRLTRNLAGALPGDLLFFRHEAGRMPFHSMIFLGPSQLRKDRDQYVLYHTGPDGANPGEIRRLTTQELLRFPQPAWRPVPANPAFLGVFRWNILRKVLDTDDARHE